ncbi:MAG: hypothetical protein IPH35_20080 [Rhodoferax sp.]|nr:hypothetical protein [Rhodoferax sp.]
MTHTVLDHQLDQLESELVQLRASLGDGDPTLVQSASTRFQRLAVDFLQMSNEMGRVRSSTPARMQRIKRLAQDVVGLREILLRRTAYVDRALAVIVPGTQKTTYAAAGPARSGYGGGTAARRAGAFAAYSA